MEYIPLREAVEITHNEELIAIEIERLDSIDIIKCSSCQNYYKMDGVRGWFCRITNSPRTADDYCSRAKALEGM